MKETLVVIASSMMLVACGGPILTPEISAIQTRAAQDVIATLTAIAPSPTLPPTATEIPPTLTPDAIAQANSIALRLDELPQGWYEAIVDELSVGSDVSAAVRVIFRNKKYALPEEEISVANDVYIYDEPEGAMHYYLQEYSSYRRRLDLAPEGLAPYEMQEIQLGDGGFYVLWLGEPSDMDRLFFVSNEVFIGLGYYGSPLLEMENQERLRFLWQLAEGIAKRAIPSFSSMPLFPQESALPIPMPPPMDTPVPSPTGMTTLVQSIQLTTDLNRGADYIDATIRVANTSAVDVNIELEVKTIDADGVTLWSDSFTFEDIVAGETLRQDLYLGAIQGGSRIDKVQTAIVWAEETTVPPPSSRTDIQLLTQMPVLVDDYSSILVRLRNATDDCRFAPIMIKYYWSDGSLRLRSYGALGPVDAGETREFRISPSVLSGGVIYAHIYLLDGDMACH